MKPTILHIHRGRIDGNRKHGRREPPIIVRRGRQREYGTRVQIGDNTVLVYSPDKPLDCGARVWIETTERVRVVEPNTPEAITKDAAMDRAAAFAREWQPRGECPV